MRSPIGVRGPVLVRKSYVSQGAEFTRETDARFEVIETNGGMVIGVRRPATPGKLYWRITQWIMPFHTMIPHYGRERT